MRIPAAFSLLELLVVMAMIGLLSGLAATAFNNIARGSGARGGMDLSASMALSARIEAMSSGYGSLLVIDNGTNTAGRFQRMAVFRYGTNGTDLEMVGKPTSLPKGVYFLPGYSRGYGTTNADFPGASATPCFYYKFLNSGAMESNAIFVFSANIMDGSGTLQNPTAMLEGRRGFLLRKNGRPAFYQKPDQMVANP